MLGLLKADLLRRHHWGFQHQIRFLKASIFVQINALISDWDFSMRLLALACHISTAIECVCVYVKKKKEKKERDWECKRVCRRCKK